MAVTVNEDVGLYDARTLELRRRLRGHRGSVVSLAFTADERHLVTGSLDGATRVWSTETLESAALFSAGDEWAVYTDDGYFDGSRHAGAVTHAGSLLPTYNGRRPSTLRHRPDSSVKSDHARELGRGRRSPGFLEARRARDPLANDRK